MINDNHAARQVGVTATGGGLSTKGGTSLVEID
jgi:hypothetical protein